MDDVGYPQWVRDICAGVKCYGCSKPMGIVHIVEVGVEHSIKLPPPLGGKPRAHIDLVCHGCGQRHRVTDQQPLKDVIQAVTAFLASNDDLGGPPPDAPVPFDNFQVISAHPKRFAMPPPLLPFGDREVELFLQRLARTSFDPRTRSFQQWLRRFRR